MDTWHDQIDVLRDSVADVVPGYLEAVQARDVTRIAVYAGVSVDDISSVRTVREVLERICARVEHPA